MQTAPGALELLIILVVQDLVDLLRQLLVDLGNDLLDRLDRVVADELGVEERLLRERAHGALHRLIRLFGFRLELALEER